MLFVERRKPGFDGEMLQRVGLAWAMIAALLLVTNYGALRALLFPDPDDIMRLIEVRDLLAGQAWYDLVQHRVDAVHGGVPMHWSRLVDIPLALTIGVLTPLLGAHGAEIAGSIIVPLVTFFIALLLAGRVAWRLLGSEATGFACLAMALSVPLVSQMRPLRIDHHGWQIVLALAAVNGLMARSPRKGGWIVGTSLALWLSISIEGLPLAAAFCGIVALRWLRDPKERAWFVHTMQALAVASLVAFAATRGWADLAQHCDTLSPLHLAIFCGGALGVTVLARLEPIPRPMLIAGMALVAMGAAAAYRLGAPQCSGGGFAELDPLVRRFWYDGVSEGLPVWHQPLSLALQIVVPPVLGLWASLKLASRSRDWLRQWWFDYALLLGASLAIALLVARAGAVAGALAAVPLGWQLAEWLRAARRMPAPSRRVLAMAGIALALLPALPVTLLTMAMPANASNGSSMARASSCQVAEAAHALNALPTGEVLAPLDIGPRILYVTDHRVIATGHHRGQRGMKEAIEIFTGSTEAAHARLAARGTAYVALCPDLVEPARYAQAAPHGFMADLLNGREPAWLEPVKVPGGSNFRIWKIRS
ncbi:MAG: hypothetical protein IE933_10305 [Sphingomonadales bacterium]|nr:hypothetical protein [Sphingomonadales bacterium]MBD3772908.1 hypothetical protein [Paracoccaceae bacterium]